MGQNSRPWGPQKWVIVSSYCTANNPRATLCSPPKASLPFDGVESSCDLKHAKAALISARNPPVPIVCLLQEFKASPFGYSCCFPFFLVADPPKNVVFKGVLQGFGSQFHQENEEGCDENGSSLLPTSTVWIQGTIELDWPLPGQTWFASLQGYFFERHGGFFHILLSFW